MAGKKESWLGTLRGKIWATIVSLLTTASGSMVAYYWNDLTGKSPPEIAEIKENVGTKVIGALTSMQKPAKAFSCDILGTEVNEKHDQIVVAGIQPGSAGALLGLKPGDIIESVDNQKITSPEILETSLARSRKFLSTIVRVRRGEGNLRGEVHLNNELALVVRRPLAP